MSEAERLWALGALDDSHPDAPEVLFFTAPERLRAVCGTEGPVFFRQAIAMDGRIAVAEHPWLRQGRLQGSYRVTVLR